MRAPNPMSQSAQVGIPGGGASRVMAVVVVNGAGVDWGVRDGVEDVGKGASSVVKALTALHAL